MYKADTVQSLAALPLMLECGFKGKMQPRRLKRQGVTHTFSLDLEVYTTLHKLKHFYSLATFCSIQISAAAAAAHVLLISTS